MNMNAAHLENRITLLTARDPVSNEKIIKKLKRQLARAKAANK